MPSAESLNIAYLLLPCKQHIKFSLTVDQLLIQAWLLKLYPAISSAIFLLSDYNLPENVMLGALSGHGKS